MKEQECAAVRVPAQPKYILPIRLFLAGLAVRLDFPAETIEDIKMAAAEACSILLAGAAEDGVLLCTAHEAADHMLEIRLSIEGRQFPSIADEVSRAMLEAMADACSLNYREGVCQSISIRFWN